MRLPDFLGIGTQKGGTTYLHGLLQQHPQVFWLIRRSCTFSACIISLAWSGTRTTLLKRKRGSVVER